MVTTPLKLTSPKQRQGSCYERLALEYLQQQGLILIVQNWLMAKVGELDLVMLEQGKAWDTLVFIEVRQRKPGAFGDALTSVTASKQRKIIKTAKFFLRQHSEYKDCECRFDVVAFTDEASAPEWLVGAFIAKAWP